MFGAFLSVSICSTLTPTELVLIVSAARRQSLARLAPLIGPGSLLGRLAVRFWSVFTGRITCSALQAALSAH